MKERNSTNISILIPIHELNDVTKKSLEIAIKSVSEQLVRPDELALVVPKNSEALSYIKSLNFSELSDFITILENDGETDFASQINFGVKNIKSEWFSILEYDDELAKIWIKNVIKYRDAYPEVELFLPIIVDTDENLNFIGFTNEAVWANGFSDEMGVLDNNALLTYQNFNTDGIVIKKSTFENLGGFKSSIKLTFIYEFLLRMTFKGVKVMTIPKFGYKHVNQRNGSLFKTYKETMDPVEAKWWLNHSKKEYYFSNDRKITYDSNK